MLMMRRTSPRGVYAMATIRPANCCKPRWPT